MPVETGGGGLTLTGQLGDVMKESAEIALSYVRSHAEELGIEEPETLKRRFHVHVSADAVVIGAGTFRAHKGPWRAEAAYPGGADAFAELRRNLGLQPSPAQIVVSATGRIEAPEEKLRDTLVLTT